MTSPIFCIWCGEKLLENASFCPTCGNPVEEIPVPSAIQEPVRRLAPQQLWSITGRIGRKDFWLLTLIFVGAWMLTSAASATFQSPEGNTTSTVEFVGVIFFLVAIAAGWIASIKRLHDLGLSGWFTLLAPTVIGWFVLMFMALLISGDERANRFGSPNSGSPFPKLHA